MPKAVKSVATAAIAGAAVGLAAVTGGAAIPAAIALGGLAFGTSVAAGLLAPKPKAPKYKTTLESSVPVEEIKTRRLTANLTISPRRIIYGEILTAGMLVTPYITTGTNKEYIHFIIAIAGHEVNAISEVWFGDKLSTDSLFTGLHRINLHLGSDSQTADTDAVAEIPGWTINHRLRGIAYAYIRLTGNSDVWINGIPEIRFKVQGRKVYDPRTSLTTYSNNSALCQLDYLRSSFGYNCADAKIDMTLASAAANICDENVALQGGGTQKRYTCNGSFLRDQRPIDIMNDLLTSSVGSMCFRQGKYRLYAGAWVTPNTRVLTLDDLRGPIIGQTKVSRKDNYNAVRGVFADENQSFKLTDFPHITNSTYETQDGGIRQYEDIELPFTTNTYRAQRIAKIHLQRGRMGIVIQFPGKLTCWDINPWDTVKLTIARYGWTEKTFRVLKRDLASDFGIDLILQEDTSSVWGWLSSEEQTQPSVSDATIPDPYTVAVPTGLTLDSTAVQLLQMGDGTVLSRIKAEWTLVPDQLVLSGGNYEIQFKKSADSSYSTSSIIPGNTNFAYITGVIDGVNYDVRVRAINRHGVNGGFATVTGHTVIGKTGSPSIPTGLAATAYVTQIGLSWDNNPDTDIAGFEIQRANDSGFTSGVITISRPLSNNFVDEHTGRGVQKYYRIRAMNRSGVFSGYTAGVTATTPGVGPNEIRVDIAVITVAAQIANAIIANAHIQNLAVDEAKIGNLQVTTVKIANNAVTANVITETNGFDSFSFGEAQINSLTISTNGGDVAILGCATLETLYVTDDALAAKLRIRKDSSSGTILAEAWTRFLSNVWNVYKEINLFVLAKDATPAASQTYVLTIEGLLGGYTQTVGWRRLLAINMKK